MMKSKIQASIKRTCRTYKSSIGAQPEIHQHKISYFTAGGDDASRGDGIGPPGAGEDGNEGGGGDGGGGSGHNGGDDPVEGENDNEEAAEQEDEKCSESGSSLSTVPSWLMPGPGVPVALDEPERS